MGARHYYYLLLLYSSLNKQRTEKHKYLIKANKKRQEKAKQKVYKAIKELKEKGEKISIRKVATLANVSVNTARKYMQTDNKIQ